MGKEKRLELVVDQLRPTNSGGLLLKTTQGDDRSPLAKESTLGNDQEALCRILLQDPAGDSENSSLLKVCKKCDRILPLREFYHASKGKYGKSARCIKCTKEYRESRKSAHSMYMISYREKNRERMNAQERAWYLENREYHARERHKWYLKNRDFVIEQQRVYYTANRDRYRETRKRWEATNQNLVKIIRLRRVNKKFVQAVHKITEEMLLGRLAYFGYACAYCSGPHEHWDHVKPLSKGGLHMLGNLRPSCRSCNLRKGSKLPNHWFKIVRKSVDGQQT
jgi:5-methylcytosine-specific restriction endonuclease McrA